MHPGSDWPAYVDEHSVVLAAPPEQAFPMVRDHVDALLARTGRSPLTRLLGTRPRAGFEVSAVEPPTRLTLAGRHRFSRFVLDVRLTDRGDGTTTATAVTYADFPGPHGFAYRTLVIRSGLHVVATRRLLAGLQRRVAR